MKKVLVIGGGGTLGRYTVKELLRLGYSVDVICLEDYVSDREQLRYFKARATEEYLAGFLASAVYDGIINFIHYEKVEEYKPIHKLLIRHTDHLIFLSSYRVYADRQHPITETAPMLLDTENEERFWKNETYAISKTRAERFLCGECRGQNWTIVRPVISFSDRRFDLFTHSGDYVLRCAANGTTVELPDCAEKLTAGLDWAGNTGKLIAHLLFKENAIGEAYTVSSGQNLTWGEVAEIYKKLTGVRIAYITTMDFARKYHPVEELSWHFWYDRLFERKVDNSKVLKATGLTANDFTSIEDGLKIELEVYNARMNTPR